MEQKLIALTFDDGPNTTVTLQTLDRLKKYNITGTFFLIGERITDESARSVERALSQGCEIENHTWTHPFMTKLSAEEIRREVDSTTEKIVSLTGRKPEFFRPPFIEVNQLMYDTIDMTFICGAGCDDWIPDTTAQRRYELAMEHAKHGEMILLHDMIYNEKTVEALDMMIPEMLEKGFEFVTVSQLFKRCGVAPKRNVLYSNVFDTKEYAEAQV